MKSCLLLIFSLMAGIKASDDEVTVCAKGWLQFTCKYPQENKAYQKVSVSLPDENSLDASETNEWVNISRFSLYHDTAKKRLSVAINPVRRKDKGDYECTFLSRSNRERGQKIEIDDDIEKCPEPVTYTVDLTAETTITCESKSQKPNFFCKNISCISEDILSVESSNNSNGRFTLKPSHRGFSVSIVDVSSQDAGSYWCGFQSADRTYRVSLTEVRLEVKMPPTTPSIIPSASEHSTVTSSTSSTTPAADVIQGGSWLTAVTAAAVCVALLVLVVILVFVYKRFEFSNNSTDGDMPNKEAVYEEIQESSLKSGPGSALNTVYITATFPTNPTAFMDYSTVNFQNRPGAATGDVYSTAMDSSQHPSYSTVNQPSTASKEPFQSTVKQH